MHVSQRAGNRDTPTLTVYIVQPVNLDPVPATSVLDQLKVGFVGAGRSGENGARHAGKRMKREAIDDHGDEGKDD